MGAEVKPKISSEALESILAAYTIYELIERYGIAIKIIERFVGASQLSELQDIEGALKSIQKPRDEIKNMLAAIRFLIEEY